VGPGPDSRARAPTGVPRWVVVLDVGAKVLLVLAVSRVALDPAWGNLEGKAPGTRALTYPLLAFLVPLAHLLQRSGRPYPWLVDLMVTVPAFSDILGNRLDLYDRVTWFDDVMHFLNTGLLGGAVVVAVGSVGAPLARRLAVSVAAGMTSSVAWEVWEYLAFVTRSAEVGTAYADTVWDLALGWLGAVCMAVVVGWRPSERQDDQPAARRTVRRLPGATVS
jgi:hypothetical protein